MTGKGENRRFVGNDRFTPAIAVKDEETGLVEEIIVTTTGYCFVIDDYEVGSRRRRRLR